MRLILTRFSTGDDSSRGSSSIDPSDAQVLYYKSIMLFPISRTLLVWSEAQSDLRFPLWPSPWCRWAAAAETVETAAPGPRGRSGPWPRRVFRWCWGWGRRTASCDCRCSERWSVSCSRAEPASRRGCPNRRDCWTHRRRNPPPSLCLAAGSWRCWPDSPVGLVRRECGPAESVFARNIRMKWLKVVIGCKIHFKCA